MLASSHPQTTSALDGCLAAWLVIGTLFIFCKDQPTLLLLPLPLSDILAIHNDDRGRAQPITC